MNKEGRACWLLVNEGNTPIKTRLTLPVDAPLCRYDLWNGQPCACPAEHTAQGACLPLELCACTAQENRNPAPILFILVEEDATRAAKTYRAVLQVAAADIEAATPLLTHLTKRLQTWRGDPGENTLTLMTGSPRQPLNV